MKRVKKWMAVAGVGMAVLMLTVVALPVAAADSVAAPAQHRGGVGGANDEYLAEALGITAAELQTAQQAAYEAGIDQALAEGLITQAQADALKERSAAGGRFGGRELHGILGFTDSTIIDPDALLADALNITVAQLEAAKVEAQDLALAQAVTDGRITQEQADQMKAEQALKAYMDDQGVQTQLQTLYENLVNQAVQAGVITQEQADTILSSQNGFGRFGGFGGHGMRDFGGRGGMRGFDGPGAPNATPDSTAPSGTLFRQAPSFDFSL